MRSREQLLRYIDSRVVDREPGGYADVELQAAEVTSHRLEIDELPWWVSVRIGGEDEGSDLPATFVPDRNESEWSVEVEHVIDEEAWPAARPGEDYLDALAAELVDRSPADEGVHFEGVEGPHTAPQGTALWYRLRVSTPDLGTAYRQVRDLDREVRSVLSEEAADEDQLYPLGEAAEAED
jgi:hypothetical protein